MTRWDEGWISQSAAHRSLIVWRGVESQYAAATMRLVDDLDEQELLEEMLEASKPPAQKDRHYLLFTPFRYHPTQPHRFRPAHARGQWYGAQTQQTVCAEIAYWRHRFILDSAALSNKQLLTEHTLFQAEMNGVSLNLMEMPWVEKRDLWTDGADYSATQQLASQAQAHGVQWIRYESVRDPGGVCAVALEQSAMYEPPQGLDASRQRWHCNASRSKVMLIGERARFEWSF